MPLMNGMYIAGEMRPYEFEACYYLHYHTICALHSIEMITNTNDSVCYMFENKSQYAHFYCDHLLFSLGQINERFVSVERNSAEKKELIACNRQNFQFTDEEFPILSNKDYRNTIEHIDEHNYKIIKEYGGVGGFNTLSSSTSAELKKALTERQAQHPYTIDLEKGELHIERNKKEHKHMILSFGELKKELIKLSNNIDCFLSLIEDPFF